MTTVGTLEIEKGKGSNDVPWYSDDREPGAEIVIAAIAAALLVYPIYFGVTTGFHWLWTEFVPITKICECPASMDNVRPGSVYYEGCADTSSLWFQVNSLSLSLSPFSLPSLWCWIRRSDATSDLQQCLSKHNSHGTGLVWKCRVDQTNNPQPARSDRFRKPGCSTCL